MVLGLAPELIQSCGCHGERKVGWARLFAHAECEGVANNHEQGTTGLIGK